MSPKIISVIERFLSKININNSCWEWVASLDTCGYGIFSINSKLISSHRFIYEYYHGSICPDLTIDHLCRNRKCVNPNHLEQVTLKENIMRGYNTAAINSRKTHCKKGHEFTVQNTHRRSDGGRRCLTCEKLRHKKRYSSHSKKLTGMVR